MSSLVTDNSKKQKKDNTEEKNFSLNKLPEVLQKHTSNNQCDYLRRKTIKKQ